MSISITLEHLTKTFSKDNTTFNAVEDVHLQVAKGEMITFLGPSGCGKTTTLRMVAGFETPSAGRILFADRDVTGVAVNKREIGFVFQNYALFPHMTVFENVAFGLRTHQISQTEIGDKVARYLEMVGLIGTEKRYPNQLSGGEQQRVALARVLVMQPQVLLMDEPLSNLDAKLRLQMRKEIRRIQKQLNLTCLYVTHDQKEALTLADRIVVMNRGRVEQVDTPFELYANPRSLFVADFIGQANVLPGVVKGPDRDGLAVVLADGSEVQARTVPGLVAAAGTKVRVIARPEIIQLGLPSVPGLPGRIVSQTFVGDKLDYEVRLASGRLIHAEVQFHHGAAVYREGDEVGVWFAGRDAVAIAE